MTVVLMMALFVGYVGCVLYRAYLLTRIPRFCQDVKHCTLGPERHRVVIVWPPNKPPRVVLKHIKGVSHGLHVSR